MWKAISSPLGRGDLGYGALKDRQDLFFCDEDWDVWDFFGLTTFSACAHCHCYCDWLMSQVIRRPKYIWGRLEEDRVLGTQMIISLDKKFEPKSIRYPILCNFVRSSHLGDYLVFDMDSSAKPLHS